MPNNLLRLDSLGGAKMCTYPYPWAYYEDAFNDVDMLIDRFPDAGFEPHAQQRILESLGKHRTDSWYENNVRTRPLLELGEEKPHEPEGLDDVWLEVAEDLCSAQYRDVLSDLTGHDVRNLRMQAHFWQFGEGAVFKPHVDKPHKIVTHLLYLTDDWTADMGGCFQVLGSSDPADTRTEIPPAPNNSIVLRRTDDAWHAVSPIPRGTTRSRKLLQVWFWGE